MGLSEILGRKDTWFILVGLTLIPSFIHLGLFFAVETYVFIIIIKLNQKKLSYFIFKVQNIYFFQIKKLKLKEVK
jgi:hypothetical protein